MRLEGFCEFSVELVLNLRPGLTRQAALKEAVGREAEGPGQHSFLRIEVDTPYNQTYKIGQNKNILDGNVSFDLGLNISYPLYKKIHFFIEPQIEYYIFTNENTSSNPFLFNLRTGVQFNLSSKKQL